MRRAAAPLGAPVGAVDLAAAPESFSTAWLASHLRALIGSLSGRRLCVAYSGGLDSSVLLEALASLRRTQRLAVRALHVNHHLLPDAASWAEAARAQARGLRVSCEVLPITVPRVSGESLEAAARAARYRVLARHLKPSELLLTAHHQEDQLETVLLALLRGSGVRGLSAMSAVTPWEGTLLLRPLLPVSRAQLERYARSRSLSWSEDPSNTDERFDRNYLRARVLPLIKQRWPAAASTVGRAAAHLREARSLLEQQARALLSQARDGTTLGVSALVRWPLRERRNALRQWIGERGLAPPDHRRLREIAGPMLESRQDALPAVRWRGGELRRYRDRLFALSGSTPAASPVNWDWRAQGWISLADGSRLGLVRERHGNVRLDALPPRLSVRFRHGGERLHTSRGRIALKDLMQAEDLAPWERSAVPLIAAGERIIAVADLWLDPAFCAPSQRRPALGADGDEPLASGGAPLERGRFRWRHAPS